MRRLIALGACAAAVVAAIVVCLSWGGRTGGEKPPAISQATTPPSTEVAALKAEIERLKGIVPDQSHAMKDVAYHYTNLWFAGKKENWPLAEFFWAETRSHLHWAVRIIPVRKDPIGNEVRLGEILASIEATRLEDIHKAIGEKDAEKFVAAYKEMLDSCYACHVISGKPFLRLRVPDQPEASIFRFEPEP